MDKRGWKRYSVLIFILIGFLLGILFRVRGTNGSELLSGEHLLRLKTARIDTKHYLYLLGSRRIGFTAGLLLSATTYLEPAAFFGSIVLFSFLLGNFLAGALALYGMKGIELLYAVLFPHCFFYLFSFFLTGRCCRDLYRYIYRKIECQKVFWCGRLILAIAFLAVGIYLEATSGPGVLQGVLENF